MANKVVLLSLCLCSAVYARDDSAPSSIEFFPESVGGDESRTSAAPSLESAPASNERTRPTPNAGETPTGRSSDEVLAAVSRTVESIENEIAANGSRSSALIEDFGALAALYEETGEHTLAIDALDHALDVIRINTGLYSLDQAPLLEKMIDSSDALGDHARAASLEEQLLELTDRNADDPRVTSILGALADREIDSVHRLLEEGSPPQLTITFGPSFGPALGEPPPPTGRYAARWSLWRARRLYTQALRAAVENGGYRVTDLFELEQKILDTYTLEASNPELSPGQPGPRGGLCRSGENAFERHVLNTSNFQSAAATATALVRLGDWRLLCAMNGRARATYIAAHDLVVNEEVPEGSVSELLRPDVPAALPAFSTSPEPADPDSTYRGYIDVSFVVSRYGKTRNVEILDTSASTSKRIERHLKNYIAQHRFRPRFVDGRLARADRIRVRYYYDY